MEDPNDGLTKRCKLSGRDTLHGYTSLLKKNKAYRLYLISHICQHIGDWMVRIGSLSAVEELAPGSSTAISIIVMAKIIPEVLITPFGGLLADRFDRKSLMMTLDFIAGIAVLYFIVALRSGIIEHLYIATIMRSVIAAIYKPTAHSITPMFVSDPEDLKRLVTLNGMAWSSMLMLGGIVAGYIISAFGIEACYLIDSFTFFFSVFLLSRISGNFLPTSRSSHNQKEDNFDFEGTRNNSDKDTEKKSIITRVRAKLRRLFYPIRTACSMTKELFGYLWTCGFGALVFMKASGTVTWGSEDVLNVLFSQVPGDEIESSKRLGDLYSSMGVGCLIGPILATSFIIDGRKPHTMQLACICGLLFVIGGWIGVANAPTFELICFFSFVRCLGGSTIWLYSTLLLQNLVNVSMLGRVVSMEGSLACLFEATIAYVAGRLEDEGVSKHEIALLSAGIGSLLLMFWSTYHVFGKGAPRSLQQDADKDMILSKGSIDMIHSPTSV